jgi:hypothetical protein
MPLRNPPATWLLLDVFDGAPLSSLIFPLHTSLTAQTAPSNRGEAEFQDAATYPRERTFMEPPLSSMRPDAMSALISCSMTLRS